MTVTGQANQSPFRAPFNAFGEDGALLQLAGNFSGELKKNLTDFGRFIGAAEAGDLARLANENEPVLKTRSAKGDRLDVVEFHPAYHALMRRSISAGLHCSIWDEDALDSGHRHEARAMRFMLMAGLEMGHLCPITMTNASVAALLSDTDIAGDWMQRIRSRDYDSSQRPPGRKAGLTLGMGMTERQGGSDVRSNTSRAEHQGDGNWRLTGEKWFFSAPMCDAFLMLAQTKTGLSCFLVPRLLPDGTLNGLRLQYLKQKLGNRSNASSEVVFDNALATLLGDEGRGVATILEMVTLTRLDCAVGSAGIMRTALGEAIHHIRHRSVFNRVLVDQPLMSRVVADMALDVVAAQALALRLARSYDRAAQDDVEAGFARLMTPVIKYWICKQTPALVYEAMECMGGNGYVEESVMPRLYREAPLNAIWEGSGNIMALDVLRVMRKGPQTVGAVLDKIGEDLGGNTKQSIEVLHIAADMALNDEGSARIFTEQLALTAAAAEMRRSMPPQLADAFFETRLGRPWRHTFGMLDGKYDTKAIIDFVQPRQ